MLNITCCVLQIFVGVIELSKVTKLWPSDEWDMVHARLNLPALPLDSHVFTILFDRMDSIQLVGLSMALINSSVTS